MSRFGIPWEEADIERLKTLWAEGMSTSKMALALGRGKNSIISKVHRLYLPKRLRWAGAGKSTKRKRSEKLRVRPSGYARAIAKQDKPPERPAKVSSTPLGEPVSLNLSLMDLKSGQCRYPHGDGPYVFCGRQIFKGSHCEFHHRLCHQVINQRTQTHTNNYFARRFAA